MINLKLKVRHLYYIIYYLRDSKIAQFYSLINRIKTLLIGNINDDDIVEINVTNYEITTIFKILTSLPEGQSATINSEMLSLIQPQIVSGITNEMMNGISPNENGELPENANWQILANSIGFIRQQNINQRDSAIKMGKDFINEL